MSLPCDGIHSVIKGVGRCDCLSEVMTVFFHPAEE